jgi:hypothetical protein
MTYFSDYLNTDTFSNNNLNIISDDNQTTKAQNQTEDNQGNQ